MMIDRGYFFKKEGKLIGNEIRPHTKIKFIKTDIISRKSVGIVAMSLIHFHITKYGK